MSASTISTTLLLLSLLLGSSQHASAQPDEAGADLLFEEGKKLFEVGKYDEACPKLAAAFKARPLTGTRGLEALCYEKIDRLASAWTAWRDVRAMAQRSGDDDRVKVAEARTTELDGKVARLVIAVPREHIVDKMKITRGGTEVSPELWGVPIPIDRGAHTITVDAPGYESWSTTIEIENSHQRSIDVPRFKQLVVAAKSEPSTEPMRGMSSRRKLALGIGAVGLAAFGTGLAFELSARSTYADSESELDPARQTSLYDKANTKRYTADGFLIAGVGVAAVATVLWFTGGNKRADRMAFVPSVSPSSVGVSFLGGF